MLEEKINEIFSFLSGEKADLTMLSEDSDKFFEYYPKDRKIEFNTFHLERPRLKKTIDKFGIDFFLEYVIQIELMKKKYGLFEGGVRMRKQKKYREIAEFVSK